MMRRRGLQLCICGALLSMSGSAHAAWSVLEPIVLGFTADSSTFVYIETNGQTLQPDNAVRAVRLDVRTGKELEHPFARTDVESPDPERSAFQKWLKKNPATCAKGPRSPDGSYTLKMVLNGSGDARGRWAQQKYAFGVTLPDTEAARSFVKLRALLLQGRKSIQLFELEERSEWDLNGVVSPCWAPDGHQLALVEYRAGHGARDAGWMDVRMVTLGSNLSWEFPPLRP